MRTRTSLLLLGISLLLAMPIYAQDALISSVETPRMNVSEILQQWDRETLLDSLDQERWPRIVNTGVMLNANVSNFIISRNGNTLSSYMRVGVEVGGFVDFTVNKHFGIQPQLLITAEQNRFTVDSLHSDYGVWEVGMDIPIYFIGHFGNMEKGYLQFGGGLFTHFHFASNVGKPIVYSGDGKNEQKEMEVHQQEQDYLPLLKLHNNHFGVCALIGYEFPIGIQLNATYRVSLSDICSYYVNSKLADDPVLKANAKASIYPEKISLGIAYRFRTKAERKQKTVNKK